MQEFDINKIKMVDRKKENPEVPIEKLLTGEYIQGLKENSGIVPNAELEGDEYLQFPEGDIQKVVGNSHEKGGADMAIPDGTKIISKTLTLKADQAKRLKKIFDIDVTTKTSYAQAVDKYSAKIGLKKLNEEQEDLFNKMKSMLDKKIPEETLRVNKEYLSKKIFDIEQKKKEKETMRAEFFDRVFDMQETAKPKGDSNPNYKNGGVSMEGFKKVAAKYGLVIFASEGNHSFKVLTNRGTAKNRGYVLDVQHQAGVNDLRGREVHLAGRQAAKHLGVGKHCDLADHRPGCIFKIKVGRHPDVPRLGPARRQAECPG